MEAKIILVSLFTLSRSFVLDSMVTELPSVLAAHDYKQLVDLILDEKHFRSQLEQQVQDLRFQLAAQNVAMQQQNNRTKATLEGIQHDLNKEKSNRHQLAQAYTRLTMEFHNLSLAHNELLKHNGTLGMQIHNLSMDHNPLSMDNVYVKAQVHDLTLKQEALTKKNAAMETEVHNMSMNLMALQQKQGYKSGFTVQNPKDGSIHDTLIFTTIKSNIGNQYSAVTGKFTCSYPGVYYFDISIYQAFTNHFISCWIRKNGSDIIRSSADNRNGKEDGYIQASNSVILHLSRGDTVDIGSCYPATYSNVASAMDQLTAFTGFLISSD